MVVQHRGVVSNLDVERGQRVPRGGVRHQIDSDGVPRVPRRHGIRRGHPAGGGQAAMRDHLSHGDGGGRGQELAHAVVLDLDKRGARM